MIPVVVAAINKLLHPHHQHWDTLTCLNQIHKAYREQRSVVVLRKLVQIRPEPRVDLLCSQGVWVAEAALAVEQGEPDALDNMSEPLGRLSGHLELLGCGVFHISNTVSLPGGHVSVKIQKEGYIDETHDWWCCRCLSQFFCAPQSWWYSGSFQRKNPSMTCSS